MLLRRIFGELCRELAANLGCAIDAHADQPSTAAWRFANRRDANVFFAAVGDDRLLAHVEEHGAAHRASPLFAAAIASPGLL